VGEGTVVTAILATAPLYRMEFVGCKLLKKMEARAGIEPAHKGFAVYRTSRKSLRKQGTSSGRSPEKPAF
jgi:hypothetical protein